MSEKILVFICSPYAGDIEENTAKAIRYCILKDKNQIVI